VFENFVNLLVIGESAVIRLDGIDGSRKGPTTRLGRIVMKSNPFSFANFHASCSARVFDTKYIYIQTKLKKKLFFHTT